MNQVNQGFENRIRIDRNDRRFESRGGGSVWSEYIQLAVKPSDVAKTAFVTKNGTYALGLSVDIPNFQKTIDIILRPVIGKYVSMYMGDAIISSPSFAHHVEHLKEFDWDRSSAYLRAETHSVYASRTLNNAERNYTVSERECLAVIWALNKFRTYLGPLPVKVITDHSALTKLTHGKNLSSRIIRWVFKLAEFNVEWEHLPEARNVVADVL
ncbi:retrovirus-related Pol polyprotein from transposon 17.6 [Trichonephila clavipes]|nr:retrovirus-related Pol polyprotein from transposon 17.6 [Trichonephila clavipes]